jgi:hypothetical protein
MPCASFPYLPGFWPLPCTNAQGSGAGTAAHSTGAVALLSQFPATIKLERPSRVCALGHLSARAHGVSGSWGVWCSRQTGPVRSSSPLPICLARRPTSQAHILSS